MVYPLYLVNWEQPENRDADRRSRCVHWHALTGAHRGYSFTGAASMSAMIGDGDAALTYLRKFFDPATRYPCQANTHVHRGRSGHRDAAVRRAVAARHALPELGRRDPGLPGRPDRLGGRHPARLPHPGRVPGQRRPQGGGDPVRPDPEPGRRAARSSGTASTGRSPCCSTTAPRPAPRTWATAPSPSTCPGAARCSSTRAPGPTSSSRPSPSANRARPGDCRNHRSSTHTPQEGLPWRFRSGPRSPGSAQGWWPHFSRPCPHGPSSHDRAWAVSASAHAPRARISLDDTTGAAEPRGVPRRPYGRRAVPRRHRHRTGRPVPGAALPAPQGPG